MKLTLEQINKLDKTQLSPEEIIYLKLRTKLTLQEIADLVGVSRQWMAKIIEGAHEKVKGQNVHT